ncbi:MAG: sugar ABC transporter permease [Clostridia bacterium]|nr:sugar ABC transporter permease [Clostridia bacterium]
MKLNKTTKNIRSYKKSKNSDIRQMDLMLLPGMLLVLIFCYIPMFGIVLAFKNFNPNLGILASKWVGFDNFKFFFASNDFTMLMRNTVLYALWFLVICNVTNIIFAIMCYNIRSKGALKYYQTTAILPTFMSIVLVSYIVYAILSPSSGVLNSIITMLGGNPVDWYSEPKYWPVILTVVRVWNGVGYGSLLYYATMVGIDETLFEAAEIDGANKWNQIIHIIIPEIMGLLCLQIIMGVGGIMGGDFGLFYQIPRNIGLLYPTTDILNTYVFRALQSGTSMGRTTAVGLFQSVAGVILLVICNSVIKKIDPEKSMF